MIPSQKRHWQSITRKSKSIDIFDRLAALTRAVFYLEPALIAIGSDRRNREGVTAIIRRSDIAQDANCPPMDVILRAIEARNLAVHEGKIPGPDECVIHTQVLYETWSCMRRRFVTINKSAELANKIMDSGLFSDAFLFGSLARNRVDAGDIDLLLFDDGEISSLGIDYKSVQLLMTQYVLEATALYTSEYKAAFECDWIDILVIDRRNFGKNIDYIRNLVRHQADPFFFLNITDRILRLNTTSGTWNDQLLPPFDRWQAMRRSLVAEGIAPLQ